MRFEKLQESIGAIDADLADKLARHDEKRLGIIASANAARSKLLETQQTEVAAETQSELAAIEVEVKRRNDDERTRRKAAEAERDASLAKALDEGGFESDGSPRRPGKSGKSK
jgi:hypothetical protein